MSTCLFTGAVLDESTRVEHTILESLGGRFESRNVSSTAFNERCSWRVDRFLAGVYAETMRALGPALPSSVRSGSIPVRAENLPGQWTVDENNQLVLMKPEVIARDPLTGKPTAAIGPTIESLQPMLRQLGNPAQRATRIFPVGTRVRFPDRPIISWQIEVALLKCILLTWDHVLKEGDNRFTRADALADLRAFVRNAVDSENDEFDSGPLVDYALGLQFDARWVGLYESLLQKADVPRSAFSHSLIVSSNPPTRTLDAVFLAFGWEAYAFRLSNRWQGEPYTLVLNNGVLRDSSMSGVVRLPESHILGRPTAARHRTWRRDRISDEARRALEDLLLQRKTDLYKRAVDYVERTCDSYVVETFRHAARGGGWPSHLVDSAVFEHLCVLFLSPDSSETDRERFLQVLLPVFDTVPLEAVDEEGEVASGWSHWLTFYRDCLDILRIEFGMPGCFEAVREASY